MHTDEYKGFGRDGCRPSRQEREVLTKVNTVYGSASIDVVDAKNTPSKFLICREIEKTIYTTDVLLLLMLT
jgi:hypothetical protein